MNSKLTPLARFPPRNPPDFVLIANLIAGYAAPAWLAESLRSWVGSIFLDRHIHQIQPTRAKMRRDLKSILNGELTTDDFWPSDSVVEFLAAFGDASTEELCRRALQSLQTEGNETRRGPGKAIPPKGIAPKTYCALIVSEAWEKLHRRRPRPKSARAGEAAELLWRAAAGDGHFGEEEPVARWRYHFVLADGAEPERAAHGVEAASVARGTFFKATPRISSRTDEVWEFSFAGISGAIEGALTAYEINVYAIHENNCWDLLLSLDAEPKRARGGGFFCETCPPKARRAFADRPLGLRMAAFRPLTTFVSRNDPLFVESCRTRRNDALMV